jgi:hypothetical protein
LDKVTFWPVGKAAEQLAELGWLEAVKPWELPKPQ